MALFKNKAPVNDSSFELVYTVPLYNGAPVCEYKSKVSGIRVIFADVKGPFIGSYLTLPIEICDDDGVARAVADLIFTGSEKYPYKDILRSISDSGLGKTFQHGSVECDHTYFSLDSIGSDNFLEILPILLDHIFHPTLTESAFLTEIHHIKADGCDGGEMYDDVNKLEGILFLPHLKVHQILYKALYPSDCSYAYSADGTAKNIRDSLTIDKIRNFHKRFYRPENLTIIIIGDIEHGVVFKTLDSIDYKYSKVDFQLIDKSISPLRKSEDLLYNYPSEEKSEEGFFHVCWRGPASIDQYLISALSILLNYFTEFPGESLNKEFVDMKYARKILPITDDYSPTYFDLFFDDVPLEKLSEMQSKFNGFIKNIIDTNDIDITRMEIAIKQAKYLHLSVMHDYPYNILGFSIIKYVVYGTEKKHLEAKVNPTKIFNKLLNEPKSFWTSLLQKFFIDNHYISIQCFPNQHLIDENAEKEKNRIKNQIKKLGEKALKEKGINLEEAIKLTQIKPPKELIDSYGKLKLGKLNFHELIRHRTDFTGPGGLIDLSDTPVFTCFDHVTSGIVYMFVLLDSSSIPSEYRVCLPLISKSLFHSSITRKGLVLSKKDVLSRLQRDTINFQSCLGLNPNMDLGYVSPHKLGMFSNTFLIMIQVEPFNYDGGIEWLHDILFNIRFSLENLKVAAEEILKDFENVGYGGRPTVTQVLEKFNYKKDANFVSNAFLLQKKFLENIAENSLEMCERTWKILIEPKNITLHVIGDLYSIKNPKNALEAFLPPFVSSNPTRPYYTSELELLLKYNELQHNCIIVEEKKSEESNSSNYFFQCVKCISYNHPDLPALMLYTTYLTLYKGPLVKNIRRKHSASSVFLRIKPSKSILYLQLLKARDILHAYNKAKNFIFNHIKAKKWDNGQLVKAKIKLIYKFLNKEVAIHDITKLAIQSYFQKVSYTYNRELPMLILNLTTSDLDRVGAKYFPALFDHKKVRTAIISEPSQVQKVSKCFTSLKYKVAVYPSLEEAFDTK